MFEIYENKLKLSKDSKFLVDQLFRIIDDDNNGGIDFRVSQQGLCNASIWSAENILGVYGCCQYGCEWNKRGEIKVDV